MRLIDADALIKDITFLRNYGFHPQGYLSACIDCIDTVDQQDTIEAAPVIHARWISPETTHYMRFVRCSLCDYREFHHTYDCNLFNYCPKCGAKMDGKGNEK